MSEGEGGTGVVIRALEEDDHLGPGSSRVGDIAMRIASGQARTRAGLMRATGLSRSTVSQRLEVLFAAGLVDEGDERVQSGGRPSRLLRLNRSFGVIAAVDVGEDHVRVALTDLEPAILVERTTAIDIASGPEDVVRHICSEIEALVIQISRPLSDLLGIGLALPAPVDYATSTVVGFSVLTGWDGFDLRARIAMYLDAPVFADNDVNLLALAEHRGRWPDTDYLFYVKAGNGIGSGIVSNQRMYRGAQGAAGDIGHIQLAGHGDPLCRCGNTGCVEALAAGWAIARDLRAEGLDVHTAPDVVALASEGNPLAIRHLREAGRALGEAVACATSLLNPDVIVVGGVLASAGDHLLAGVREIVYQRALPLATRKLRIIEAHNDQHSGVLGAAHLVLDNVLDSSAIDHMLARR